MGPGRADLPGGRAGIVSGTEVLAIVLWRDRWFTISACRERGSPARCRRCRRTVAPDAPESTLREILVVRALCARALAVVGGVARARARARALNGQVRQRRLVGDGAPGAVEALQRGEDFVAPHGMAAGLGVELAARRPQDVTDRERDERVALKVLPPGIAADRTAYARFMREAQTAGQLHHQNVVSVHAAGFDENTPYYAMEYVEGETLRQIATKIGGAEPGAETIFASLRNSNPPKTT